MIKIYLNLLILILSTACLITTLEIYRTFKNYSFLYLKSNKNHNEFVELLQVHIRQKNWLACILEIEEKIKQEENLQIEYYNIIGYCYYSINIYNLADYYYQKALYKESNNIITLLSLGKIYTITKKYQKAYSTYYRVNMIKPSNIAQKKLKKLEKYLESG
uniref:hypothetical protein n=1 Tax=Hypnea cornuta TaxID=105603 RepID=UPI0027DA756B|nr:hypothetical protein REP76_pgp170 [Hypnea cornuta]WCH55660.1 hypothetical protein [Hypnea cornuta]